LRFESYAERFEDLMLYCVLKDVDEGFYIDIGANDPTADSVTKFFYDRGWHGINIEPLMGKCALLAEKRPRDINLCVGLGRERGKLKLFESDKVSTFSAEIAGSKPINTLSNPQSTKKILTLSEVYETYPPPNREVHFCKIDVEGFEEEVLRGVSDWNKFRPWVFCIESTLPRTKTPSYDKWEHMLLENDYVFAAQLDINRFYVDMAREYLLPNFTKIDQFLAQNEIVKMVMMPIKLQ